MHDGSKDKTLGKRGVNSKRDFFLICHKFKFWKSGQQGERNISNFGIYKTTFHEVLGAFP